MTINFNKTHCLAVCAASAAALLLLSTQATGDPVCDDDGGAYVCVNKSGADPVEGSDFRFDFTDPDNPDVEFLTGDPDWVVWSQVSSTDTTPAKLGALTLDPTVSTDDFVIEIRNGSDAGAAAVSSLSLVKRNWTGFSSIYRSIIDGDLNGNLVLQEESGVGGQCELTILGKATGNIIVPRIKLFQALEGTSGTIDTDVVVAEGMISIGDSTATDCGTTMVSGAITVGTLQQNATLRSFGDLEANITVEDAIKHGADVQMFGNVGTVTIELAAVELGTTQTSAIRFGRLEEACSFYGDLKMVSGVNEDTILDIRGRLQAGASVDLNDNDVAGSFLITRGGPGTIFNGGDVTTTGTVTLSSVSSTAFTGAVTFDRVLGNGVIRTLNGSDLSAALTLAVGGSDGTISSSDDSYATITCTGAFDGTIAITEQMLGDIEIGGTLGGSVSVGLDVFGDTDIGGSVSSGGTIDIGKLSGYGRILIAGICDGVISIDEGSTSTSSIHIVEGFDGSLETGTAWGSFDFNGDILFGPESVPLELLDYSFDGCVDIDGNLDGDIDIIGCLNVDPAICVEGTTNGTISIIQTDCSETHSVDNTCPACP